MRARGDQSGLAKARKPDSVGLGLNCSLNPEALQDPRDSDSPTPLLLEPIVLTSGVSDIMLLHNSSANCLLTLVSKVAEKTLNMIRILQILRTINSC
jgi:hypothetical protein